MRAEVVLDSKRSVPVEFVDVQVTGTEALNAGGASPFLRRVARLVEGDALRTQACRLPFTFDLPRNAPPSYRGPVALVRYDVDVHVSIPWWPDRRARFAMQVAPLPLPTPLSKPGLYSSNPEGPRGSEAHAELSLASHHAQVGGEVAGALAVHNVGAQRYTTATVGLRAIQETRGPFGSGRYPGTLYAVQMDLRTAKDGASIPFRFRVPDDATPSLPFASRPDGETMASALRWVLDVSVGVRFGASVQMQVPFEVLSRKSSAEATLAPVPVIGEDRLAAVWEQASQPLGFVYAERAASMRVGETEVRVTRENRGRDGTFLRAALAYPALHLDLRVAPASWAASTFRTGVLVGDEGFDAAHRVDARDPAQSAAFLQTLLGDLSGHPLRSMDDATLVLETKDGGGDRVRVTAVLARAKRIAGALEEARGRIPPPSGAEATLDEWRALATAVGGELETARMQIVAEMMSALATIRLEQVSPPRTSLRFVPASPVDPSHRVEASGPKELDAVVDTHGRTELGDLFRMAVRDIDELRIDEGMTVGFAGAPGLSVGAWGAADVQRRLELMARLVKRLGNESGPYR